VVTEHLLSLLTPHLLKKITDPLLKAVISEKWGLRPPTTGQRPEKSTDLECVGLQQPNGGGYGWGSLLLVREPNQHLDAKPVFKSGLHELLKITSNTSFTLVLPSQSQFLSSLPVRPKRASPTPSALAFRRGPDAQVYNHGSLDAFIYIQIYLLQMPWEAFTQLLGHLSAYPAGLWSPGHHPKAVDIRHQEPRGKAFLLPPPFIFGGSSDAEQSSYTSLLQLSWTSCLSY